MDIFWNPYLDMNISGLESYDIPVRIIMYQHVSRLIY